jgi:hypothetical protein
VKTNQHFEGIYFIYLQGQRISQEINVKQATGRANPVWKA